MTEWLVYVCKRSCNHYWRLAVWPHFLEMTVVCISKGTILFSRHYKASNSSSSARKSEVLRWHWANPPDISYHCSNVLHLHMIASHVIFINFSKMNFSIPGLKTLINALTNNIDKLICYSNDFDIARTKWLW